MLTSIHWTNEWQLKVTWLQWSLSALHLLTANCLLWETGNVLPKCPLVALVGLYLHNNHYGCFTFMLCVHVQLCPTCWAPWTVACQSAVHGTFQARILEWAAISYSRASFWPRDPIQVSCIPCTGRQILYHCATWGTHVYTRAVWFSFL